MSERALNRLRWMIEIFALVLFTVLTFANRLQLWFGIFLLGVIISIFAGRYYCGWICPMNTLFRPIGRLYKKLKIKRFGTPKLLSTGWFRYIILIIFLTIMVLTRIYRIRINLLLYIVLLSIIATLFIEESFWHRQICPFGTILSLTSGRAKIFMEIDEAGCISCGACQKECPSGSIITKEDGKRFNQKQECLLCYHCIDACPTKVCKIGNIKEIEL